MFRTAMPRYVATAMRTAAMQPARRRIHLVATRPHLALIPLRQSVLAMRMYSDHGGPDKEQVEGRIMGLLHGFDKVNDTANIKPNAHFANDLGLDSLDTVEVVMAIEEEFSIEIPDKDADTIHSIDKAVEYILAQPHAV
ncbi:hypothetical protein CDD82_3412 [Ophiocordyceps australis]|uniref:Acyl carrier protein n=1 Tax=Ophiocordyceps australis TaxID=1399860 RepID=A0A2C5XPK9_9HYPO|nr:hypothetical protein CDD82_3412 [Ophiocordyceps australis]